MSNLDTSLEELKEHIVDAFAHGPPNGWLLDWDARRYQELVEKSVRPYAVTNHTSFDYSFCNCYRVEITSDNDESRWILECNISFIADLFVWHCTYYPPNSIEGVVVENPPITQIERITNNLVTALRSVGLKSLPDDWYDARVEGVTLELSDPEHVTASKCLFHDNYAEI